MVAGEMLQMTNPTYAHTYSSYMSEKRLACVLKVHRYLCVWMDMRFSRAISYIPYNLSVYKREFYISPYVVLVVLYGFFSSYMLFVEVYLCRCIQRDRCYWETVLVPSLQPDSPPPPPKHAILDHSLA